MIERDFEDGPALPVLTQPASGIHSNTALAPNKSSR